MTRCYSTVVANVEPPKKHKLDKPMKTITKLLFLKTLGLTTYLYIFALYVIAKLKWNKHEKDILHFINLLPDEGIILDLGANIGVTSYYLAKYLPNSIIYSFEPLEINMNTLRRIKSNFNLRNIREYQMAVGNENTRLEMVMPVINKVPMHGLCHAVHEDITWNNQGPRFEVPMVRLDSLSELKNSRRRVTGIKLDLENFEYFALLGAENLIKEHHPVIYCELWDNPNRTKCILLMKKLGYKACVLHKGKLDQYAPGVHTTQNFFFIPD